MVQAIAADPTDSGIVFTGSFGGLARSMNGGVDWSYLSDDWISQEVSAIAIDPSKPNNVFVGTGRENMYYAVGVYSSKDTGNSWTGPLGVTEFQGKIIRAVAVDPINSDTVYVANGCSPYNFPCTAPTPGLWRSDDSGQSWVQKAPSGTSNNGLHSFAIDAANANLYAATDAGLFTSTNHGDSWTSVPGNKPAGQLRVVDSVLYLLAWNPSLQYKELSKYNGGGSWTSIPTCPSGTTCLGQNLNFGVFAVEPGHSNVILAGGIPGDGSTSLWRTENAGSTATWTIVNNIHVDQRTIAFAPDYSRNRVVYVGNDGGIIKSINHGQTWTNCNQNLPGALLQGVAISKDDSMIGGTQDNGAVFTYQGAPWNQIGGGDGAHGLIDPVDSTDAYFNLAGYRYWGRYRHLQNPNLFDITPPQLASDSDCHPLPPFSMSLNSPFQLITACRQVVRSSNNGTSWTSIGPAPGIGSGGYGNVVAALCQAPSNTNVIYAAANNWGKQIWVTINANNGPTAQWNNVTRSGEPGGLPIGTEIFAIAVDSTASQIAYLACPTGIFKTTDTGGNWTKLSSATFDAGYTDIVLDPLTPAKVFAASRLGVISSPDGGGSWQDLSAGLPGGTNIRGLSYNRISQQLAANTYGRGAYVVDLDSTPPSVSITSPAPGMIGSGNVTISATASDNHRVVGVTFWRDGNVSLGSEDMVPPYSIVWNTGALSGPHSLTAIARDPANNTNSSTVIVYVIADK
jgi:photosystem II stability/assembly factor-like uncharacterized protein